MAVATPQQMSPQGQQYNPLQPSYQSAPTWLNPSYAAGSSSNYNTNLPPGAIQALSPQATIQQILAGLAPQAAQATTNLNNTLAASGMSGGPANVAQTELQGQLQGSIAPAIAQAIQGAQQNVLGAQEFQSGQGLQQALANAGLGEQTSLANSQLANQLGEFNVGNQIGANQFNASAANNAGSQLAQMLFGGWGQELGQYGNILDEGLSGMGNIAYGAGENFPVQQGGDWSGLGQGLGSMLGGLFGGGGGSTSPYFGPW